MKSFYNYLYEALRIKSGMSNISTKPMLSRDPKEKMVIYDNFNERDDWETAKDEDPDFEVSFEDFCEMNWEDAQNELKQMDRCSQCVVLGEPENWHGKKVVLPDFYDNLMEALKACMKNHTEHLRLVLLEDGSIKCTVGYRGTSTYQLIGLNDKGYDAIEEWEEMDDEEYRMDFLYKEENRFKFNL